MNMVIANLFKHKVHFELTGHESDQYEPYLYSKGYHYHSNEVENGESVGITSVRDLYRKELKPLFRHILSTIMLEMVDTDNIAITVSLICGEDYYEYDIVAYEFHPEPDFSVENCEARFYTFPENLLNDKFSIRVETYAYIVPDRLREEYLRMQLNAREHMDENNAALNDDVPVPITPPDETYKQERCVICLESAPNILYLDCMHIAVCNVCDDKKRTAALRLKCDVCRATISRRIRV